MAIPYSVDLIPADSSQAVLPRVMGNPRLRLRVGPDRPLGCVSVDIGGAGAIFSAVLSPPQALDLAIQLIDACGQLKRVEARP